MTIEAQAAELLQTIHRDNSPSSHAKLIVDGCAKATDCAGVALTWSTTQTGPITIAATDGPGTSLELVAFILGEGPQTTCIDTDQMVLRSRLSDHPSEWVDFTPEAFRVGVTGIFAFPLRLGRCSLGVLTLYRRSTESLTDFHLTTALAYADVAVALLIEAPREGSDDLPGLLEESMAMQAETHQAAGMISAQLDVDCQTALNLLRDYALSDGLSLSVVARAVVSRRLTIPRRPRR